MSLNSLHQEIAEIVYSNSSVKEIIAKEMFLALSCTDDALKALTKTMVNKNKSKEIFFILRQIWNKLKKNESEENKKMMGEIEKLIVDNINISEIATKEEIIEAILDKKDVSQDTTETSDPLKIRISSINMLGQDTKNLLLKIIGKEGTVSELFDLISDENKLIEYGATIQNILNLTNNLDLMGIKHPYKLPNEINNYSEEEKMNIKLSDLGISHITIQGFEGKNMKTIRDLIIIPMFELLNIPKVGKIRVKEIIMTLDKLGINHNFRL